jgi:hypothetical protein
VPTQLNALPYNCKDGPLIYNINPYLLALFFMKGRS